MSELKYFRLQHKEPLRAKVSAVSAMTLDPGAQRKFLEVIRKYRRAHRLDFIFFRNNFDWLHGVSLRPHNLGEGPYRRPSRAFSSILGKSGLKGVTRAPFRPFSTIFFIFWLLFIWDILTNFFELIEPIPSSLLVKILINIQAFLLLATKLLALLLLPQLGLISADFCMKLLIAKTSRA